MQSRYVKSFVFTIFTLVIAESFQNHVYSKVMREYYHRAKSIGEEIPKILGLSASIVVKSVKEEEEFKVEKAKLEAILDAEVETCDEIDLETFVSFAETHLVRYPKSSDSTQDQEVVMFIRRVVREAKIKLQEIKNNGIKDVVSSIDNKNNQATALESLRKDLKYFSNYIIGSAEGLLNLGLYSLMAMKDSLMEELDSKSSRSDCTFYNISIREEMETVTKNCLLKIYDIVINIFHYFGGSEKEKIVRYSCNKVIKLLEVIEMRGFGRMSSKEMRCIIFVERKLTARALVYLIWKMKISSVLDVGFIHSSNAGRNVKDPRDREEICQEARKMSGTLARFRTGEVNVLVSTSVVEEGIDVPSCNLVVKFDFPQTFRSYVQSRGRARQKGSKYFLMIEDGDAEKVKTYEEWVRVYDMSIKECHEGSREPPAEVADSETEYYETSVARVSGSQALQLLHHYLQKITVDRFTRLTIAWTVKVCSICEISG